MLISLKFAKLVAGLVDDVSIQLRKEFYIKKNWGYPAIPQTCGISTTVKGSGCGRFVR